MNTIALELSKDNLQTIGPLGNVLFNTLVLQKGDIDYNSTTGEILINKEGRYAVNWALATQASVPSVDLTFAIKLSTGEELASSSPMKVGQITGFGIVQVDVAPMTLTLASKQANDVYLSVAAKVKAHLTIGELLECNVGEQGPPGPPGIWETGGLQLLGTSPGVGEEITIASGEAIPFNNPILSFNGVTYEANTIKIYQAGYYLVSWEFIAKPSALGDIVVSLEDLSAMPFIYGKSGGKSQAYSVISGTTLVMVSNVMSPYYFGLQLINRSGIDIIMTSASSQIVPDTISFASSLTVVRIGDIYFS